MDAAYSVYREILIWDNKNRRAQIIKKQKHTLATVLVFLTLATVATVAFTVIGMTITPKACSESPRLKYYTTYTVGVSDSLYNISEQYMSNEYEDVDQYISEVCNINHLQDADSIYTGETLILPYYSAEFKQ